MPRVSIGLPVYNGERYVGEAIECVLGQTYRDLELVICDNASTDRTESICRAYTARDPRVRYHRNESNIGAAPNFNLAFELSVGEYFKWAAHDDGIAPGYIEACVAELDKDPTIVLCHTESDWVGPDGEFIRRDEPDLDDAGADRPSVRFRNIIYSEHFCLDIFGLIRRTALERTPCIASYIGSDRNLLAELSLMGRLVRVPCTFFHSRDHAERSIRSMPVRSRGAWFDPELSGKILLPFWRNLAEYWRSIGRVPLPVRERAVCYPALLRWMQLRRRRLVVDLRSALRQLGRRAVQSLRLG